MVLSWDQVETESEPGTHLSASGAYGPRCKIAQMLAFVETLNRYYELFREHGIPVGQVLTMKENFSTRRHYLNQKNLSLIHI